MFQNIKLRKIHLLVKPKQLQKQKNKSETGYFFVDNKY